MNINGFSIGDKVRLNNREGHPHHFHGTMTVDSLSPALGGRVGVQGDGDIGAFFPAELVNLSTVEAVEAEPEAQPVTYRICVGNVIGKTEYPSEESAKQAALLHGKDGEEFSIWEVVKVADFRVKVTKSVEPVEAA